MVIKKIQYEVNEDDEAEDNEDGSKEEEEKRLKNFDLKEVRESKNKRSKVRVQEVLH